MDKPAAEVEIVSGVDLAGVQSRLEGEALRIFEDSGREMLKAIKDQWVGWKYIGRKDAEVGESRRRWQLDIQATEGFRSLTFTNDAKTVSKNRLYAGYVKRRRGATKEWKIAEENLIDNYVPRMIERVVEAVKNQLAGGPPVKLRENKQTTYREMDIDV